MKAEAAANAETDKKARETAEKLNAADSLIFQTEKQLNELGDKITADQRSTIEVSLNKLKEAHKMQDLNMIDTAMNELNQVFSTVAQNLYQNPGDGGAAGEQGPQNNNTSADDVTDVEFEEVNDNKK